MKKRTHVKTALLYEGRQPWRIEEFKMLSVGDDEWRALRCGTNSRLKRFAG